MTPSNADRYAEVHERTDDRMPCPVCQSMANGRECVVDGDMIIGMIVFCTDCGCSINTVYTHEWEALVREEEAKIERERQLADRDYVKDEFDRLAKGGYY